MPISSASAASASSTINHMVRVRRTSALSGKFRSLVASIALAGCSLTPEAPPAPPTPPEAPRPLPTQPSPERIEQARSIWVRVDWADLPGWADDSPLQAWPALRASCTEPKPPWHDWCARVQLHPPEDDAAARRLIREHLQPYRVMAADGNTVGLATGYFEPLIDARRRPDARHRTPLHALPADLAARQPYWTRREIDTLPAAMAALRGREIAWVADPLDALVLQIQGSGRVRITEPDGQVRIVRLAFAGHNGQPYKSVGRWLIEQSELGRDGASWPAIRGWTRRQSAARVQEMLWANPRTVFFREEALPDPTVGPRGALGVPLTPGRSIAVDPQSIPYGAPVWLASTEPLSDTPLRRLVAAQDTGSAIVGAVRADYFWGWGEMAEAQAGRMKQPLQLWVLWPKVVASGR